MVAHHLGVVEKISLCAETVSRFPEAWTSESVMANGSHDVCQVLAELARHSCANLVLLPNVPTFPSNGWC